MKDAPSAVEKFHSYSPSVLIDITDACAILHRSRASIYRHFKSGELTLVKVGSSSRIRVGELRRLIGEVA